MSNFNQESVLSVHHWTDTLFSFTTTRDPSFRFRNGEFTMIGLKVGERPLLRAYSVASANYEDRLEFFSIKVPDGPLTSRLQHLKQGDEIIVSRKATGTLVIDNLHDGRNLYLIGTGTGLAPFLSVIKDPETYQRFQKVILLHGCRRVAELAYGEMITERLPKDELIGDLVRNQLIYYPTVTRDPFKNRGRITDLITSGKLFTDAGLAALEAEHDRVMICGSPALVHDTRALLAGKGFVEGNHGEPAQFAQWASGRAPALQTPGAKLFALAGLSPAPVGVRQARARLDESLASLERLAAALAGECLDTVLGDRKYRAQTVRKILAAQCAKIEKSALLAVELSDADFPDAEALAVIERDIAPSQAALSARAEVPSGGCRMVLRLGQMDVGLDRQWGTLRDLLAEIASPKGAA